jgi:glycosyltransferase involved in cell wall biosynthesis
MAPKIKIAYIVSFLSNKAPIKVLFDIVKNLDSNIFDIYIITLKDEDSTSLLSEFDKLNLQIFQISEYGKFNLLFIYLELSKFIKRNNIEIIHSHCTRSLLLSYFLKKNRLKKLHTIHSYPGFYSIATFGKFLGKLHNHILLFLIKNIDYPIACSNSLKHLLKVNHNLNVIAILNGVDGIKPIYKSKNIIRQDLLLDSNTTYFLCLSRFSPEKNLLFLIESFLKINLPNVKLIALGDGQYFEDYKNKYSNRNVVFPGFKSNIEDYISASDYYVSSSLTEGLPLSVIESLSFGLPLLLSNIEAHLEIFNINPSVDIGIIFHNNDFESFNNSIISILSKEYKCLSDNCFNYYQDNFTSIRMSNEYKEFYLKLLYV